MPKKIETEIVIQAPAEEVYKTLLETEAYSTWNPFITSIDGEFKVGEKLEVVLTLPNGSGFKMKPTVLIADGKELRWRGKLLVNGLFDGEHYFKVEKVSNDSCKFIHGEQFSGILVGLLGGVLKQAEQGFQWMNQALKKRAEV